MLDYKGRAEGLPYSISRWTDVPADKWLWFRHALARGSMLAIDPRTAFPGRWSLLPEETRALVFWTKNPTALVQDRALLAPYDVWVHLTVTGWTEVEPGAPDLAHALALLEDTVGAYGPDRTVWRFTPIPMLPPGEVVTRFHKIAQVAAKAGLSSVYVAYLQENDLMPEMRSVQDRVNLLDTLSQVAASEGVEVRVCQDDRTLVAVGPLRQRLHVGVCAPATDFGENPPPVMDCGCSLMVDPFTINEACSVGCKYCYAASRTRSPHRRNTT